jgi:hypothetical protein
MILQSSLFSQCSVSPAELSIYLAVTRYRSLMRSGSGITYDSSAERFWSITVEFAGKQIHEGKRKPFPYQTYAAILQSDSRDEIERKLGVQPSSLKQIGPYLRAKYEISPHLLDLIFDDKHGSLQALTVYSIQVLKIMFSKSDAYDLFANGK